MTYLTRAWQIACTGMVLAIFAICVLPLILVASVVAAMWDGLGGIQKKAKT